MRERRVRCRDSIIMACSTPSRTMWEVLEISCHLFSVPPSASSPSPSELITARFNVEECLYAAAVCLYSQGEWQEAREVVDRLLRLNPDHRYGNELHLFVKDGQGREGGAGGREGGEGGYEGSR